MIRILGIDPGYAIMGWGVIEKNGNSFKPIAYGSLTTDKDGSVVKSAGQVSRGDVLHTRLASGEIVSEVR